MNAREPDATGRSILVVDDDDVFRERLIRALRERGHEVRGARNAFEAAELAGRESPEWAIVDFRMPGTMTGVELVSELKRIDAATEIVVLTGYGSIANAIEAVRRGARHYFSKPASVDAMLDVLEHGAARQTPASAAETPSLARVEWEHIQRVMTDCGGNVSAAARVLGIHRRSLQRKLAKYPARR